MPLKCRLGLNVGPCHPDGEGGSRLGILPSSSKLDGGKESYRWQWYTQHVFSIPVNNVIAARQFNVADIYVHPNESETSKQATHLFVQNVLHLTLRIGSSTIEYTASPLVQGAQRESHRPP